MLIVVFWLNGTLKSPLELTLYRPLKHALFRYKKRALLFKDSLSSKNNLVEIISLLIVEFFGFFFIHHTNCVHFEVYPVMEVIYRGCVLYRYMSQLRRDYYR